MSQHFISRADAESNFLDAAAYLAESIPAGESHGSAIATVVPQYLEKGKVDLAAELANTVDDPFTRDRLLIAVAGKCAEIDDDEYGLQLVEAIEDPGLVRRRNPPPIVRDDDPGLFELRRKIQPGGLLKQIETRLLAEPRQFLPKARSRVGPFAEIIQHLQTV